jgi:hypothetical protein
MNFTCHTDKRHNRVKVTDAAIGAPLTAACWFLAKLPKTEQERADLTIYVQWEEGLQAYEKDQAGRLYASGS